jgi:hypothetical protein
MNPGPLSPASSEVGDDWDDSVCAVLPHAGRAKAVATMIVRSAVRMAASR